MSIFRTGREVGELEDDLVSARGTIAKLEERNALLERYADSIAMWMERENVTDQERLSYIKGHPITRAAADRSGK